MGRSRGRDASNVKLKSDTGVNCSAAVSYGGELGGCEVCAVHANAQWRRKGRS